MGARLTVNFNGFEDMMHKLDNLNADLKKITEKALAESFNVITPKAKNAIAKHKDTGKTIKSLIKYPKVEWDGDIASVKVGFDIKKRGLSSIFLMYGTPRHQVKNQYGNTGQYADGIKQDKELYNAFYGSSTKRQLKEVQQKVFADALQGAIGNDK